MNTRIANKILIFFSIVGIGFGCTAIKRFKVKSHTRRLLNHSPIFSDQFTGFCLYDITDDKFLINHQGHLRFTPASNTKLLTMYACLKSLGDSIPTLKYQKSDTSLIVSFLADPTFLHPQFQHQPAIELLRDSLPLVIQWDNHPPKRFGNGWAWDDYEYDYQQELSKAPIYGNSLWITQNGSEFNFIPKFFEPYVQVKIEKNPQYISRYEHYNAFTLSPYQKKSFQNIPFKYSKSLFQALLAEKLGKKITFTNDSIAYSDTLFSYPTLSLLATMMKKSDNFLAEQLLLISAEMNGFDYTEGFIEYVKVNWLNDLNEFRWVDGSGLSRYNLIAPVDFVKLLKISLSEFGWDQITAILPTGGEGTLKNLYIEKEPFIFAKTGSLSNNHNLSGFIITKSGKKMIFSLMNNHFMIPSEKVKWEMEKLLTFIRNEY